MKSLGWSVLCLGLIASQTHAAEFLISERNASSFHLWDTDTQTSTLFHTERGNDADVNFNEGLTQGWLVDHYDDQINAFTPGSGSGVDVTYNTPYAYPKHVTVFDGSVFVMSRNDGDIIRYDTDDNILDTYDGSPQGQGMATDGTLLYASYWDGTSSFIAFDNTLTPVNTFTNPTGLGNNVNIVDFVYDAGSGTFYGLATNFEQGTVTSSNTIVEFTLGGSVLNTYTLAFQADGIGQYNIPEPGAAAILATSAVAWLRRPSAR